MKNYDPTTTARGLARVGCLRADLGDGPEGAWLRATPAQKDMLSAHLQEALEADQQVAPLGWTETAEAEYWRVLGRA